MYDDDCFVCRELWSILLERLKTIFEWSISDIARIFEISQSSVNNLLGNSSMTNENRTKLSKPQFVYLFNYIDAVYAQDSISTSFAMFILLCPVFPGDDRKLMALIRSERDLNLSDETIIKMINESFPGGIEFFNKVYEWISEDPGKRFRDIFEYDYVPDFSEELADEEELEYFHENIFYFIQTYLKYLLGNI